MSGSNGVNRLRSRTPAAAPTSTASIPNDMSWALTGNDARAAAEAEVIKHKEAAERRASGLYMPFRFFMRYPATNDIIVLDTLPGPSFYEHNLKNPATDKWDIYETCPKTMEPCPICSGEVKGLEGTGKDSYFVMMLSVIDLVPYIKTDKKTGATTEIPFSRKLLPVKTAEQGFFMRQLDRKGTLRGMHLLMARDTKEMSSIGRPELVLGSAEDPDFNGWHSEADIIDAFGSDAVLGEQGKILKPANINCYPFEYSKLFQKPSGENLRKKYHVGGVPGSAMDRAASLGGSTSRGIHSSGANTNTVQTTAMNDLDDDIPF